MKRFSFMSKSVFGFIGFLSLFLLCQSCMREDLRGSLPVIKEELVGEYLTNNPELFSEFTRMLDTTGVMGLLNAYGIYTVFAPTNEAIAAYYATLTDEDGLPIVSMNQLSLKDIKEFCYNHIVKGDTIKTKTFKEGALGSQSMSERYITVSFQTDSIMINGSSLIVARDIERHNGIIHVIKNCLAPAHIKIGECFEADYERFSIYVDALRETGIYKTMVTAPIEDESYDFTLGWPANKTDQYNPEGKPTSRKFGYTILAVSDEDLQKCTYPITDPAHGIDLTDGVDNLAELEALAKYYYSRAFDHDADNITDRKDPKHYLNRFMAYHCFDRILLSSRFVKDLYTPHHFKIYAMREYIETMLENTIVEVLLDEPGKFIPTDIHDNPNSAYGVFNFDDPLQGAMLTDVRDLPQGGSLNGYYHGITKPIMYSQKLSSSLSSKRLRIDGATFFPELTTNNLRGSNPTGQVDKFPRAWVIDDAYLDGIEASPNTRLSYVGACLYWENYQGDMYMVRKQYNLTFTTIPIPAGTYEVRFGFKSTDNRGIAQLYLDSLPCGIPLDLAIKAENASIGWVKDGTNEDDPYGYENDKMMHNRGYMKGSSTYRAPDTKYWNNESARKSYYCIRRVLGIYTFDKTEKHKFTAINLGSSNGNTEMEFMLDYLEFCPLEIIDKEDIE